MPRQLLVSDPRYYANPVKPLSFENWVEMYEKKKPGPVGLWRVCQQDKYSGEILVEQWLENILTDNGATAAWKNWVGVSTVTAFNYLLIGTGAGVTTLTTQITSGTTGITSISVAALPAAIPSGTTLVLGAGSATTQSVTTSGTASLGATSITVTSFTASATFGVGSNVAPQPSASDNPSSLSGTVSNSGALTTSQVTFSGTGSGNRQISIAYTFSSTGTPAASVANYTECWLAQAATVTGAGQTAVHVIFNAPMAVNSASTAPITITEKI